MPTLLDMLGFRPPPQGGTPPNFAQALMQNPLLHMGLGILSQGGGTGTERLSPLQQISQGMLQGMGTFGQIQQAENQQQYQNLVSKRAQQEIEEYERKSKESEIRYKQFEKAISTLPPDEQDQWRAAGPDAWVKYRLAEQFKPKKAPKLETVYGPGNTKFRAYIDPDTQEITRVGGSVPLFAPPAAPPQVSVTVPVNLGENEFVKGFGRGQAEMINAQGQQAAQSSIELSGIQDIERDLESGIYAGKGGPFMTGVAKIGKFTGLVSQDVEDKLVRTEVVQSGLAKQVLGEAQSFKGALSREELKILEDAAGKERTLEPETIKKILSLKKKVLRFKIDSYNKNVEGIKSRYPGMLPFDPSIQKPPEPQARVPQQTRPELQAPRQARPKFTEVFDSETNQTVRAQYDEAKDKYYIVRNGKKLYFVE